MTFQILALEGHGAGSMEAYRPARARCVARYTEQPKSSRNTFVSDGFPEAGGGCAAAVDGTPSPASGQAEQDDDEGDPDPEPERRRRPSRRRTPDPFTSSATLPPLLLTLPDVLAQCQLSRSQIYSLVARGEFPEPIKIGRSARWLAKELEAWIERQLSMRRCAPTAPLARASGARRALA